jgi:hypothetical protein
LSRSRIAHRTTRHRTTRHRTARLGAVLAAALATLVAAWLALPGAAMAATLPPAVSAQLTRPQLTQPLLAAANVKTIKTDYTCDLSGYGPSAGAAAVSVTATTATSWPVNQPDDITLDSDAIDLPAAVTSRLGGVDSIAVSSQIAAKHATKARITLAGLIPIDTAHAPTAIPATTTLGQVTFAAKGSSGSVALPAQSITFTPRAGATIKPAITCTTSAAAKDVTITVGAVSGPFYHCTTTVANESPIQDAGPAPLSITETGTKKTGDSLTVSLTSAHIAQVVSTVASEITGVTLDNAAFSADLPVTGAQSGTLHIAKTVTDLTATTFSASAKLDLTKAGTVKVGIPSKFGISVSASGTVALDFACTLVTKPVPVALTLTVTQGPASTPTPTPTPTDTSTTNADTEDTGAATDATGTPVGGAATGGGPAPGSPMPLAFGGIAMVLVGGGLILSRWRTGAASAARRRRSRGHASGADSPPAGPSSDSPGGPAA